MSIHYGYGRIFGIAKKPTSLKQKVRCFDFCNKLNVEWGGWYCDETHFRSAPLHKRNEGAVLLGIRPGGIITTYEAAFYHVKSFIHTFEFCAANGIALYCLDVSEENLIANETFLSLAKATLRSNFREAQVESYGYEKVAPGKVPLGWKYIKTQFCKGDLQHRLVPDYKVRLVATQGYKLFLQGLDPHSVAREMRNVAKNPVTREGYSFKWYKDAFKAVVCGFPNATHIVKEAFTGFSFRAWRLHDPATLAALKRISDTFQQSPVPLPKSDPLTFWQRLRLRPPVSAAEAPKDQP